MPGLIFVGSSDFPATAARNDTKTASNASLVPELNVVPPTLLRYRSENALNDEPDLTLAAVERNPGTAASGTLALPPQSVSESPPNDLAPSHLPVRWSGPTILTKLAQKSTNSQPAGSPSTSCCASVSYVCWVGL